MRAVVTFSLFTTLRFQQTVTTLVAGSTSRKEMLSIRVVLTLRDYPNFVEVSLIEVVRKDRSSIGENHQFAVAAKPKVKGRFSVNCVPIP